VSTVTSTRTWSDIDDILGPRDKRFFGALFRSARQSLDVDIDDAGPGLLTIAGAAAVSYGSDWGTRNGASRVPHLSSIDMLVMAARVVSRIQRRLWDTGDLAGDSHLGVQRLSVNAGTRPDEEMADLACHGSVGITPSGGRPMKCDLRVGQMRARVLMGPVPGPAPDPADVCSGDLPDVSLTNIELGPSVREVFGDVAAGRDGGSPGVLGYATSMLASAQLAQVLIVFRDRIPRADSNTLWMRRFDCAWNRDAAAGTRVRVDVNRHELLSLGGRDWSIIEGRATGLSTTASYSVAHDVTGLA
jgi:hypothetical protein